MPIGQGCVLEEAGKPVTLMQLPDDSRWSEHNRQPCKTTGLMPAHCSRCGPWLSPVQGPRTSLVLQKMSKAFL